MWYSWHRTQKQRDRDLVVEQKEKNKRLEEEIEKQNIEQQRLKETSNGIKVEMKEIARRIVGQCLENKSQNILEQQIRDENQTTLELGEKIVASPRKLKQDVSDMKDEYARLTAECRTLTLQATDLQAQNVIVKQAAAVAMLKGTNAQRLEGILQKLEESQRVLESREMLNQQLEGIKNRIRELKKELEDGLIEQKVINKKKNE